MTQDNLRLGQGERALKAFIAAWLTPDAAERRRQLDLCWSDDGVFLAPNADSRGRDALAQVMTSGSLPVDGSVDTSELSEHHGCLRYTWNVQDSTGQIVNEGLHVAELDDDGRFSRVIAFYGPTPAPRSR